MRRADPARLTDHGPRRDNRPDDQSTAVRPARPCCRGSGGRRLVDAVVAFRANRIVPGKAVGLLDAMPTWELAIIGPVLGAAVVMAITRLAPRFRLLISLAALGALAVAIGDAARFVTPIGDKISRTSPGTGFWLLTLAFALMA